MCATLYTLRRHFSISIKTLKKSNHSSNLWLERQKKDPYVKRAIKESYRARSAFKLIEIDDRFGILNPGDNVIDIGAAPGSWTQVAVKRTNADGSNETKKTGFVIGIDLDHIEPINGAQLLTYSDVTHEDVVKKILDIIKDRSISVVLSDMAPNASGQRVFDHDCIINLQEKAFNLAKKCLKENGTFLCKLWYGDGINDFTKALNMSFQTVKIIKPDASRSDSAECFILAQKFKKT